jgi:chromosomal replication initiation ATPase DnaA
MRAARSVDTLERVLAYLEESGLPITREVEKEVVKTIVGALERDEDDLFETVMVTVANRFSVTPPQAPPASPPINRRSISYGDY